MASSSRRARRAKNNDNMSQELNLTNVLGKLNSAVADLDTLAQSIANEGQGGVMTARVTQALVLSGTAVEILGGLAQQVKLQELQDQVKQAEEEAADEATDEASEG